VQNKELPDEMPVLNVPVNSDAMLSAEIARAGLAKSRSEARRLMEQKAVEVNGSTITEDVEIGKLDDNSVVKVGKRRYLRIRREKP